MLVQENQGAENINRINKIFPDHFIWINSQLKARKFLATRGREVLIKKAGGTSVNIVNIPDKSSPSYINAWIMVYNYAIDYLEGALNSACLENKFIQRIGNNWVMNKHYIVWPNFSLENAEYARGLDRILDEYIIIKNKYIRSFQRENLGIAVNKSSVHLKPANEVSIPKTPRTKVNLPKPPVIENKLPDYVKQEKVNTLSQNLSSDMVIQKISDGDLIDTRDVSKLRELKTDIVVLTCQDALVPKEEDIFLANAEKCQYEGFNTGAFIYGKATDEHTGAIEIKRILRLLYRCGNGFTGLVIYSIDNEFVLKNKDSDIKLLDFINMYNSIGNTLKQSGYKVMISMNLQSGQTLQDIYRRYNMRNEHEIIYMAVVRDIDNINNNVSSIVVDPGNDYDIVSINNNQLNNELKKSITKNIGLAKVG